FIKRKNAETDFKTELYNTLKNSLDYIDYIKNSLHGEFNALNELHGKLMEDYKLNIKEIGDIFHEMIATNERDKIELKDDQFLIDFYKIKINWSKLNLHGVSYTDIYVSKKNFIEPMIKLCKTAEADFRAVKILKHAMECIYAFNDLIELKRTYRGIFIMNARGLQESMFRIKRTMLRFNSM
ncbi:MAG: hypothetical protein IPN99_13095, partial [Bacteroidetes bacterium]|nr:hypothetical protein [Bacteroidota bacterium]